MAIIRNKMSKVDELNKASELISRPTAKNVRLAADILRSIIYSEMKGVCKPSLFKIYRFEQTSINEDKPLVKLKKFICSICPRCGSRTFDLNTEIMQGQCLSCSFKSKNYKYDMLNRKNPTGNNTTILPSDTIKIKATLIGGFFC